MGQFDFILQLYDIKQLIDPHMDLGDSELMDYHTRKCILVKCVPLKFNILLLIGLF